jgi:hypothetical protein
MRDFIATTKSLHNRHTLGSFLEGAQEQHISGLFQLLENYGVEYSEWKTDPQEVLDAIGRYEEKWLATHHDLSVANMFGYQDPRQSWMSEPDLEALHRQQKKEIAEAAFREGIEYTTQSFLGATAAYVATFVTDDPRKITGAAGAGVAASGALGAPMYTMGLKGLYSPEPVTLLQTSELNVLKVLMPLQDIHKKAGGIQKFRDYNPTVKLETAEGIDQFARGPTSGLTSRQKAVLPPDCQVKMQRERTDVPRDQRVHPDIRVLVHAALSTGLTPTRLTVAGQPFCPSCSAIIQSFGGVPVSFGGPPYEAWFGGPVK